MGVITLGEVLVEMLAREPAQGFRAPGTFLGPYPSGAPAIFIDQVARMGASGALVACIGADDFGAGVLDRLRADGVDLRHVRVLEDATTGVAFVSYDDDGSRHFIFHLADAAPGRLTAADITPDTFLGASALHIMGSSLFSPELGAAARRAADLAAAAGAQLSFDPNVREELLRMPGTRDLIIEMTARADIVLPSDADLRFLRPGLSPDEAARSLLEGRAHCIFRKRGSEGSTYYDRSETIVVPPCSVAEIDPTGAGDCAGATFLACLLEGRPPEEAARRANAAGAIAVTRRGPMEGNSTRAEIDALLARGF